MDRKYIVSYEYNNYIDNFPYNEIDEIRKNENIHIVSEIFSMVFCISCYKGSEDDLIRSLKADQVLFSDDGDNFFKPLSIN